MSGSSKSAVAPSDTMSGWGVDEWRNAWVEARKESARFREAVEALVDVMPYCHPNPNSPHAQKWEEWRQAALDKAALALGEAAA